ncbi:MAG: tetratricopeptide repeat protein [Pedosphaera sp.]|nr:tetratricopeptide repeat protein [Pedosphaera sp.]
MTTRATNAALLLALGLAAANSFAAVSPESATVRFLKARVQSDPLDSVAQNRLAIACVTEMRETGDLAWLDRAAQSARASLASTPAAQNPGGLGALALVEFEFHHFRESLALAQQAYGIDPRNTAALATAGDAQLELGHYAEAETIYEKLKADEVTPSVRARLAHLAELKGDHHAAIELLRQNVGVPGETAWHRVRLGEIYFRTGRLAEAEAQYAAAQKLQPESFLVLEHLAELRAAQGKFDDAIALYQKVVARVPRGEFFQALGDLYAFRRRPAEAREWHARAQDAYLKSVAQGNAHYYHHLAGFYSDAEENPAEALRWARKDLEIRQSVNAHESLAWAFYKNGDFARAAEEMTRALALGTKDAHWLFHAALIYSSAGEVARGRKLLDEARALNPEYGSFHAHR